MNLRPHVGTMTCLDSLPIRSQYNIDYEQLFQAAFEARDLECAIVCAAKVALAESDFHPLAILMRDEESAKSWIERNAPTKKAKSDWLTILEQSSQTPSGVGLQKLDPAQIPDLIEDVTNP